MKQNVAIATFIASMSLGTTALAQDFSGCTIDNLFQRIDCNGVVKSFAELGYSESAQSSPVAPLANSDHAPSNPADTNSLADCIIDNLAQRIDCNGVVRSFAEMNYRENARPEPVTPPVPSDNTDTGVTPDQIVSGPAVPDPVAPDQEKTGGGGGDVRPLPPSISGNLKQVKAVRYKPLNIGDPRLNTNYSYYWAEVYPGRYAEFLSLGIVDQKLGLAACERYRDQVQGHIAIDFMDGSSLSMDVSPTNRDLLDRLVSIGNFLPGTIYFEPLTNDKLYLRIERLSFFSINRIKDIQYQGRSLMQESSNAPDCNRYSK